MGNYNNNVDINVEHGIRSNDTMLQLKRPIMDEDLRGYIEIHRKKAIFKTLREVWQELQIPSRFYLTLNPNTKWSIKIHAIYENGIAIYHEERDGDV
jgi:hypothetical protein